MAINQISTANTFEQWLIATQSLIAFANSITNSAPGTTFTSNTSEYVITGNLTVGNTVTCVTMNTDVIIFDDGTRLSSNVPIVNAYAHANGSFTHANGAFNKANSANVLAQAAYNYANTIVTSGNVTVANTITANVIVANVSITTNTFSGNNITVINTVTTNNVTANLVTAVDINTTSDMALKDNVLKITNSLDILEKITGLAFNWKSDGVRSYGVSAQEVEKILPEIVRIRDDGYKGVNYLNLIAFLIEAIKDLKKDVSKIKNHININ